MSPQRHWRPGARTPHAPLLGLALLLSLLGGCGEPARPQQTPSAVVPPTWRPDQLPDIPLPAGFEPAPEEDQLAVSLAGGTVRRLVANLRFRGVEGPDPAAVLADFGRQVEIHGWIPAGAGEWRKGTERLTARAGRDGTRTMVRIRLRNDPAAQAP